MREVCNEQSDSARNQSSGAYSARGLAPKRCQRSNNYENDFSGIKGWWLWQPKIDPGERWLWQRKMTHLEAAPGNLGGGSQWSYRRGKENAESGSVRVHKDSTSSLRKRDNLDINGDPLGLCRGGGRWFEKNLQLILGIDGVL